MKKLLFLFLMLFAVIGFIGCNNTPEDVDVTEFVKIPTNLSISGTTLTWSAVTGAKGYFVYVNDVKRATVSTNSYNFGSLSGDVLIFRVQTQAQTGYKDSALSVSIAYMANKTQEIAAINTVLGEKGMSFVPEGFAEELANKGMTSAELNTFISAAMTFSEAASAPGAGMLSINTALKTFMATAMNIEAMISAVLVTVVPGAIENAIANLEIDIQYYQDLIDMYPEYEEFYASDIAEKESDILMYQNIQAMLAEADEETLLFLTETVNYLIAFQDDIDEAFLSKINDLMNDQTMSFATLVPEEIIVIKNEFVAILRENIPTMEQMVLLINVANIYAALLQEESASDIVLPDYTSKYAAQTILMFRAGIEYIDTFDLAFVTEVKSLGIELAEDNSTMFSAELSILIVKYIDKYLDENEDLMDQIDEIFTEAEKTEMFEAYIATLSAAILAGDSSIDSTALTMLEAFQNLTYAQVKAIYDMFDTSSDALLDSFVATDGEIVRQIAIMNGYDYDYMYDFYENSVLDETYESYEDYQNAQYLTQAKLLNQILIHFGVAVDELTDDDIEAIVDFLMVVLPFDVLVDNEDLTATQLATFKTNAEALLTEQLPNYLQLGKNLFEFIDVEEMMDNLIDEMPDMLVSSPEYSFFIFYAEYYYGVMDSENKGLITDISSAVFAFLKTAEFRALSGMLLTDINNFESGFNDALDFTISEANAFRNYNPDALTAIQRDRINAFTYDLQEFFTE